MKPYILRIVQEINCLPISRVLFMANDDGTNRRPIVTTGELKDLAEDYERLSKLAGENPQPTASDSQSDAAAGKG